MADTHPSPKRVRLNRIDLESLSKEDLIEKLYDQDAYINTLGGKGDAEMGGDETEIEKWKAQVYETTRRENILVKRLTNKEQEIQERMNQIQELKQANNPSSAQLRGMMLDPAVNLMFLRMKKEMDGLKEKLEQAQNDLAAWKFTPDSQTGKRLMARCRMLLQENEELGKVISSGRTAKLEGEIALTKTLVQEMKKSQTETDEFLLELDEDVEGMQSTIYFLQQELKESKDQVTLLKTENEQLRNCGSSEPPQNSELGEEFRTTSPTHSTTDSHPATHKLDRTETSSVASSNYSQPLHQKTTNGDHHVAMETDTSEGQQEESCDEYQTALHSQSQTNTNKKHTSKEGAYRTESTDISSDDAWSPQHKHSGNLGDNEQVVSDRYRTESKSQMPNGVPEYDSQEDEEMT